MAEVFLGRVRGPAAFERPVAVKRILPHLASDRSFVEMFVREAQIAASIRHARVVQVHELTTIGQDYAIVMEYVHGESLGGLMRRLWLRGESLDRVLAAHLIAEVCAGLHAAHELTDDSGRARELVHRDVSPQNIMITYAGEVKILDFGIARASDSARTQEGQLKGKCEYMSPEQCRGEPLDRRSDLFSLGVVLYELTTGTRLFKRDGVLSTLHAVCHDPIREPREIDPGYPPALEGLCARALVRDRDGRYATARDMRRDLLAAIRNMSGPGQNAEAGAGADEALGAVMSRLFADRIAEKRSMMHQVRSGSKVVRVALAEVDTQLDASERDASERDASERDASERDASERDAPERDAPERDAPERDASASLAQRAALVAAPPRWPACPRPHRRMRRGAVIAGATAVVLGFGIAQRWGGANGPSPAPATASAQRTHATAPAAPSSPRELATAPAAPSVQRQLAHATAPAAASAQRPARATEPAESPPPPGAPPPAARRSADRPRVDRPDHIALIVASTPPGASVLIAGALRGRTPCSIEVPRGEDPITVVVARDGFPPVTERVTPGTDQRLVVHLAPSAANPKLLPGSRPTPSALDTPAVFERFE